MQSLDAHIDREFIAFTAIAGLVAEDTCNDKLTTDHSPRATATALPRSTGPLPHNSAGRNAQPPAVTCSRGTPAKQRCVGVSRTAAFTTPFAKGRV